MAEKEKTEVTQKYLEEKIEFYLGQRAKVVELINKYNDAYRRLNGAIESLLLMLKEVYNVDYEIEEPEADESTEENN